MRQLIAGPTRAEGGRGFRTYVPAGTRVRSVSVANGIATVDLTERFASGSNPDSLLARLSQLVRTLTGLQGTTKVQLLIERRRRRRHVPRRLDEPPDHVPLPRDAERARPEAAAGEASGARPGGQDHPAAADRARLPAPRRRRRPLRAGDAERDPRVPEMGAARPHGPARRRTKARLATATHPAPLTHGGAGKRAEILLDRQVALLIDNNQVVRTIAVSSGKPSTPTPPGDYRVYAKIPRWWSVPFREWLPWALPFVGGIAFHEFADVPAYPASHGCVRQSTTVARWTYDFAYVGMPVKVIAKLVTQAATASSGRARRSKIASAQSSHTPGHSLGGLSRS